VSRALPGSRRCASSKTRPCSDDASGRAAGTSFEGAARAAAARCPAPSSASTTAGAEAGASIDSAGETAGKPGDSAMVVAAGGAGGCCVGAVDFTVGVAGFTVGVAAASVFDAACAGARAVAASRTPGDEGTLRSSTGAGGPCRFRSMPTKLWRSVCRCWRGCACDSPALRGILGVTDWASGSGVVAPGAARPSADGSTYGTEAAAVDPRRSVGSAISRGSRAAFVRSAAGTGFESKPSGARC